jgi:hypothetical protein
MAAVRAIEVGVNGVCVSKQVFEKYRGVQTRC